MEDVGERVGIAAPGSGDGREVRPRRDDRELEPTVGSVSGGVVVKGEPGGAVGREEGDDRVDRESERRGVDIELEGRPRPGRESPLVHVGTVGPRADLAGAGVANGDR